MGIFEKNVVDVAVDVAEHAPVAFKTFSHPVILLVCTTTLKAEQFFMSERFKQFVHSVLQDQCEVRRTGTPERSRSYSTMEKNIVKLSVMVQ